MSLKTVFITIHASVSIDTDDVGTSKRAIEQAALGAVDTSETFREIVRIEDSEPESRKVRKGKGSY